MTSEFARTYGRSLKEIYANAISMVTILTLVVVFVLGGYDLLKLAFPEFTLNAALHEKYQTNESYTEFGQFQKGLSEEALTYERTENYKKLLRMERQNALQRLAKTGLAVFICAVLNGILIVTCRRR